MTASFDRTRIGENPAAAATRDFGVASVFASNSTTEQKIEDPSVSTAVWKRKIEIQRFEGILAGKGKLVVPEVYVSANKGERNIKLNDSEMNNALKVNLVNNQFNLAYHLSKMWKVGVIFFNPQVDYNGNEKYNGNGINRTYTFDRNSKITGLGIGTTTILQNGFAFSLLATNINEKYKHSSTFKEGLNAPEVSKGNDNLNHFKRGFGIAYQDGNSKSKGFRFEFSHIKMEWDDEEDVDHNVPDELWCSQNQIALEFTSLGFTAGVSFTRIYGSYVNYRYLMDSVLLETGFSKKPVDSFGGFLGFKSKSGSSFGGFVSYFDGKTDITLMGDSVPGTSKEMGMGLSYSYVF